MEILLLLIVRDSICFSFYTRVIFYSRCSALSNLGGRFGIITSRRFRVLNNGAKIIPRNNVFVNTWNCLKYIFKFVIGLQTSQYNLFTFRHLFKTITCSKGLSSTEKKAAPNSFAIQFSSSDFWRETLKFLFSETCCICSEPQFFFKTSKVCLTFRQAKWASNI